MGSEILGNTSKCFDLHIFKIDINRIISIEDIDKKIQGQYIGASVNTIYAQR